MVGIDGPVPHFGREPITVRDLTEDGYEVYARLFAPHDVVGGGVTRQRWSTTATSLGVELTPYTTWEDLLSRARDSELVRWERPRGTLDHESVRALVEAVSDGTSRGGAQAAAFVLWSGYAGEVDDIRWTRPVRLPNSGETYLSDGSFYRVDAPLSWAFTRADEHGVHFPVACWVLSGRAIIAGALYHDSWYISCERETLIRLRHEGLDALEIDRDAPIPSAGD